MQEKCDKLTKRSQNGTILSFLKPKATFVPLTLSSPALIHSSQQLAPPSPSVTTALQEPKPHLVSRPINDFVNKLQNLVNNLPKSVPEALESDTLAVFERNPKEFDHPTLDADELWETTLNNVLKSTLGWGMEGDMSEIVCYGQWGLDGLVKFVTYFVENWGVSQALFKGKLLNLMTALEER